MKRLKSCICQDGHGSDFEEAANAAGGAVTPSALFTRQSENPDEAILVGVFNAMKPSVDLPITGTVITSTGEYAVYSLSEVIPGRPESIPLAERDAGKISLTQQSGNSDYVAFVSQLEADADIAISDSALQTQDIF